MTLKHYRLGRITFRAAILGLWLLGLGLRLWQLGEFNQLVFDEVYYAKFANYYLIGRDFFNSHPPLSQYFIAIGMKVGSVLPSTVVNGLTGSLRSPISYRWMNALLGSLIPLAVGGIAYQLTRRRTLMLISMGLMTLEGFYLVESRYAFNNIYLLSFGLAGQYFFLRSLRGRGRSLAWAGLCFGLAAAAKWSGLGFLLGVFAWWAIWAAIGRLPGVRYLRLANSNQNGFSRALASLSPLAIAVNLLLVPALTYSLAWIPHLWLNPQYDFGEVHREIWRFHRNIGSGSNVHPYCSPWYSWLLMVRPVAYLYQAQSLGTETIVRDVHGMGNPILWWSATLAMAATIGAAFAAFRCQGDRPLPFPEVSVSSYSIANFAANLLPWLEISRCTFLYHYLAAYCFAILSLAVWLDRGLASSSPQIRGGALALLAIVALAFLYWLPIYWGLPLSEGAFRHRMWFRSWI
jgi:dolichyl-phosphate-mannose--protein O-mannosyl transferase